MKYTTGSAFRQALENRIKDIYLTKKIPIVRLRKLVAFERFITRLQTRQPDSWILKGGLAMQLRLGIQSRTTKDIDLLNKSLSTNIYDSLAEAALLDLSDWFSFAVEQSDEIPQDLFGGNRYHVRCLLDGRVFEAFHVDVGIGDLLVEEFDCLHFDPILEFAGISSAEVPCYPIPQQIADKLHALSREYASGGSSRVKDLVDILLLAGIGGIDGSTLAKVIHSTFENRALQPVPRQMPALLPTLNREYRRLAKEVGLLYDHLSQAEKAAEAFINPVLSTNNPGIWDAESWEWK